MIGTVEIVRTRQPTSGPDAAGRPRNGDGSNTVHARREGTTRITRTVSPTTFVRGGSTMADKSPKKSGGKTAAAKTLKEKRIEKKDKSAAKRKAE